MSGRRATALLLAIVGALACTRQKPHDGAAPSPAAPPAPSHSAHAPPPPPAPSGSPAHFSERTWHYPSTGLGPSEVVVLVPDSATKERPAPVVVAFHGRGESLKGPKAGARGWVDDYAIGDAAARLSSGKLRAEDLLGFVTDARLAQLNAALAERPYRGVIVVCPFLPDVLKRERTMSDAELLARFVVDTVLPRVYRETPAIGTAESTGVDGVSLGGRASLLVGFARPAAFGVVSGLQPALDESEAPSIAELAKAARAKNPRLRLRLLTSDGDYFLDSTLELARELEARGVPRRLDVVTGPHSYEFNRGPGDYELLLFHDRALRGEEGP